MIDGIYYINLDARTDRKEHMVREFEKAGIALEEVTRFSAINGTTHNFTPFEESMVKDSDYYFSKERKDSMIADIKRGIEIKGIQSMFENTMSGRKVLGNQLSHYYIMKEMIEKNYKTIVVFQDDMIFRDNFKSLLQNVVSHLPPDSEVVNVGIPEHQEMEDMKGWDFEHGNEASLTLCAVNDYVRVLNNDINPATSAYILTLQGARNYVNYMETLGVKRATDCAWNDYLQRKGIFYASSLVLCTCKPSFGSDIFPPLKN